MAKRVWDFLKGELDNVVSVALALCVFISANISTLAMVAEVLVTVALFAFFLLF